MSFFLKLLELVSTWKRLILATSLIAVMLIVFYLRQTNLFDIGEIILFLRNYPALAPVIFIVIYALMIVFLVPTLPMNLVAGILWGTLWGGLITLISVISGASLAFLISRYLAHDYFADKFKSNRTWSWFQKEVQKQNWKAVAFIRANPVFPFGLFSYFFGLTRIHFLSYLWSTAGFILPGVFVFTALGASLGGFVLDEDTSSVLHNIFLVGVFVALLVVVYFGSRYYTYSSLEDSSNESKF